MKMVYTHENKILVENAKNLLSQHEIPSIVRNEYLSSGMGELSAITIWPELWVLSDLDYEAATSLILRLSEESDEEDWVCPVCKEANDATFELCWNCQGEKP